MAKGLAVIIRKKEEGITGLETAIILIAFVVAAAVFAYTALTAGLFSTQKSQEAVYSGIKEAQGSIEIKGGIYATGNTTGINGNVKQISFVISKALGGDPIDFTAPDPDTVDNDGLADTSTSKNVIVINYIDGNQKITNLYWTIDQLGNADNDVLLENEERFEITIGSDDVSTNGGNLIDALSPYLTVDTKFTIEIQTAVGPVLSIERTTPSMIDNITTLR